MREAISAGRAAAHAEYKSRKMSEQTAEQTRQLAEEWAEGHEDAIEDASDHGSDDLERIYGPVKELARHTLDVAEHNDAMHRLHAQSLLESGKRVELLQVLRAKQSETWFLWAGSAGAAAAGVLLVAISRRRRQT